MSWSKKMYIFIKAGFEHIIPEGIDHILFVLGLFFSTLKLRSLILQVTAFTFAHSITLALAALGFVKLQLSVVEPLIFLSIVWVAVENTLFEKTTKWRPFVVFSFGLLHGLGFATLLTQYGLPKDNFISLLNECELVRYSALKNDEDKIGSIIHNAKDIITEIEKNIK